MTGPRLPGAKVRRRRGLARGFTLVELLVAITVLAIALLPIAGGMANIIRLQWTSEQRLEMETLGSDKVAELQAWASAQSTGTVPADGTDSPRAPSNRGYRRDWTFTAYPAGATPLPDTYLLTVSVRPLGSNRSPVTVSMVVLVG